MDRSHTKHVAFAMLIALNTTGSSQPLSKLEGGGGGVSDDIYYVQ